MGSWRALAEESARWRDEGRVAELWWRDDDATDHTVAFDQLLAIRRETAVPLALAVIPARATAALAQRLSEEVEVDALQHGYAHVNHAPPAEKKIELGGHRPAMVVLGELGTGWLALERQLGDRALPVLVPPWNRIAPGLLPTLPEIGFRGLSTFGPRRRIRLGLLREVNTHVDLLDWKGHGGFVGEEAALDDPPPRADSRAHVVARAHRRSQSSSCDGRKGVGFPKVHVGKGTVAAGTASAPGAPAVRCRAARGKGGRRLSSADLRYPPQTLWADYIRASAGMLLCALPLLFLEVNRWLGLVLLAGLVLFAVFLARTALRHRTRYLLAADTLCADGPAGAVVEWNRLDRLKLSYFSTKRDRSSGWMQLTLGSAGGRAVKINSTLDCFHDVVERAAEAASETHLPLSRATRANLRAMGISVADQEETV